MVLENNLIKKYISDVLVVYSTEATKNNSCLFFRVNALSQPIADINILFTDTQFAAPKAGEEWGVDFLNKVKPITT